MFNGVIRISSYLKGSAFMALLATGLTSGFLPKALALEGPVFILRGWDGTVVTILWMFVFGQLILELIILSLVLPVLFSQALDLAVHIIHKGDQVFYLLG